MFTIAGSAGRLRPILPCRWLPAVLVVCMSAASTGAAETPDYAGLVAFRHAHEQPLGTLADFGSAPARVLHRRGELQQVAVLELPAGWRWQPPQDRRHTLELFVLEGELAWGEATLGRHAYAWLPSRAAAPVISASAPARVLVFLDPPRATDAALAHTRHADDGGWRAGVVAERDAGVSLPLEVRDLLWVEQTGQRTWLLRAGADLVLPWERHKTVEEGFIVAGEYRLSECLPEGAVSGAYTPGGYFYRPPGIVHGGPESGSDDTVVMLLRTPTALTVEFLADCQP